MHLTLRALRRLLTSGNPCADPQNLQDGDGYTDPEPRTGYEPNRIVDNQIINKQEDTTCTKDNQITEIEGHVKSLSYNQSLLSSTQRLEQIRALLQVRNDRKFITLKENA